METFTKDDATITSQVDSDLGATPIVSSNLPTGPDIVHIQPPGVNRVFRSDVWDHFFPYWIRNKKYEKDMETQKLVEVITWKMRAKCKYCPKHLGDYACDSGPNGTGGPRKHIYNNQCKYYAGNANLKKQKVLAPGDFNQLTARAFDQKETLKACVEMVVLDELPFSFVEKQGFKRFCSIGMPLFKVPSRRTLVRTFLDMYGDRKLTLKDELKNRRVCLTTDTWTSVQNCNYMVLTAHFIDNDWKMHKRVLNFCVITNHQGVTIANLIEQCLSDWGIEKVLTITVDNASANETALEILRSKLNIFEKRHAVLDGQHMHMRCVAHITNLIVGSGLKKLNSSILAIRNAVKFVRSSPQRFELFKKAIGREKLPFKGLVCLDMPTRWNSTFIMLESALRLKRAFKRMEQDTTNSYLAYFNEDEEEYDEEGNVIVAKKGTKKVGPPLDVDWDNCEVFVNFLKVFYEVTIRVSASLKPVVHTTLHDIIAIEQVMANMLDVPIESACATDLLMVEVGLAMKSKYNKYFSEFKKLNPFIILGLVLDPRFKLKHITHVLTVVMGWKTYEVEAKTTQIKTLLFSMYEEYDEEAQSQNHLKRKISDENTNDIVKRQRDSYKLGKSASRNMFVVDWTKHVEQTDESIVTHEIDRYLNDPLEAIGKKNNKEVSNDGDDGFNEEAVEKDYRAFDILQWWKLESLKYPILASISRDVFAIQVSSVASESAFSTGGRVIDAFRSSLTPSSVEALICMQNWLKGDDIITHFDVEPCIEELEFYEAIETESESGREASGV